MEMNYDEFVSYLLKKYGPAKYDYFTNATCKTKSKRISRTKEGLFCHHIDEDNLASDTYSNVIIKSVYNRLVVE